MRALMMFVLAVSDVLGMADSLAGLLNRVRRGQMVGPRWSSSRRGSLSGWLSKFSAEGLRKRTRRPRSSTS